MAKFKSIEYRLVDSGKSPFRYKVQIKGFLGLFWKDVKSTIQKYSLDNEPEADYWVRKHFSNCFLVKKNTKKS